MTLRMDDIFGGYNTKGYDQFIMKACVSGFTNAEVKAVNDWIISGRQGWDCPLLRDIYFNFNNVDLMDDVQRGISLKSIEGHMGMDITESTVSFDVDHPWTDAELEEMIYYCKKDVEATEKLWDVRKSYLQTKINIGKRAGISAEKALACTNAKLTALMLHAQRKEWTDGREYEYPSTLDKSVIPKEILDFFDSFNDKSIPDDVLFDSSLDIVLGDMACKYQWGGVHGSQVCYYEEETEDRAILNDDVSSLYPSLIEIYHYLSRNVPDPQLFYDIRKERIKAKHDGDKQTAKDLKLPLNTVSGAQENQYNDLYDPKPTRSMRISGQLFLTVFTMRLLNACETIKLLNYNTDGLMYSIDKWELPKVEKIREEWQAETKFELETDHIRKVWIKDVNNLFIVMTDGHAKKVGGYLNYGISEKGAWAINNNAIVVKKALCEYFEHGTPLADTVNADNDIFDFQFIAKAGSKYSKAFQLVDGQKVPTQKCNRVYATKNKKLGTLYKVKAENGQVAKIESLPEHCIIDNKNELTIEAVDKKFYIDMAEKKLNDYLGIKPEKKGRKKMAEAKKTPLNIYQKLTLARKMFSEYDIKKSGKNMSMAYKYFELEDIVPIATSIFDEVGLAHICNFGEEVATMDIIDCDNLEHVIQFTAPFHQIKPIVSNNGKQVTNEMQALGSSITYMRRYLYMIALDICESDSIDGDTKPVPTAAVPTPVAKPTVPATPQQRAEVKAEITAPTEQATELQIKGLKATLKKLIEKDKANEELVQAIAVQTHSFTELSKVDCEKLMEGLVKRLEA